MPIPDERLAEIENEAKNYACEEDELGEEFCYRKKQIFELLAAVKELRAENEEAEAQYRKRDRSLWENKEGPLTISRRGRGGNP